MTRRVLPGALGAFTLAIALLASGSASAEGYAYDLAGELMSPYCPGRTLASCPSPQAAELIQWIALQEAAGATEDDVVEMLIDRFGEEILGAPKAEGVGLLAYVVPVAGFFVGGGIAFVVLRRIVGGSGSAETSDGESIDGAVAVATAGPAASSVSDEELARLVDAELEGRR